MIPRNPESTCPSCSGPLLENVLVGVGLCVACAWQGAAESEGEPASTEVGHRLFVVPGHEVLAEIGRGGEGVVYRARQSNPSREVALKMLLPRQLGSDEMIARFRGEARTIASLDHPAILPVYNADLYRGIPFFTMQLAGGGTLAQRRSAYLRQWREIAALIATVADAVQFAHSRGVIHRDLKPGNILFSDDGRAFVSDFGLAKFAGAETATEPLASVLGTPAYLAPEVVRHGAHAATTAADIYGLGAVLYELLAQTPPFSADSFEGLLKAVTDSPPKAPHLIIPGVPGDLEIICLRCLAKDPVLRFVSASELAAELRRWLEGRPILSNPVSSAERLWRWCRRRPALAALTLALMLVVTGGGMAQWLTNRSLKRALVATHLAEADARQKLHASLLAEARLQSRSRQPGQRDKTLEILARAAQIAPTVEVRSETASALTRADLRLVRELPGTFLDNITNTDFSPELDAYLLPLREGGFARQSSTDGQVLAKYSAPGGAVPRFLRFSRDGRIMSAILPDLKTGFWWTDRDAPAWLALPENGGVTPTAMHPSRPLVAYRRGDAELRVHDLLTGNEETLARDGARIFALAFDPAGARLAVLRRDAVELRDAATAAVIWSLSETPLGMAPAWSDDGFWFATGSAARNDISIREAGSGLIVQTLSGHTTYPGIVKFLPGGKQVVSIAYDRTLRLWDVGSGRELLQVPSTTRGLTLSRDGRRLASAGETDQPALFEWAEQTVFRELLGPANIRASDIGFDLSSDGAWLVTGDRYPYAGSGNPPRALVTVAVWDGRGQIASFEREIGQTERATVFLDRRAPAITYSATAGGIWQRRLQPGADGRFVLGDETPIGAAKARVLVRIEPEGDWIVRRLPEKSLAVWPDGDPAREADLFSQGPAPKGIFHLERRWAVSRDTPEGPLHLWSTDARAEIGSIVAPRATGVAFSPGGDRVVVAGDKTYRAWTLPDLQPGLEWPLRNDGDPQKVFSFSPSGRWFVGELGGSAVELRDGHSFELLVRFEPPLTLELGGVRWSPDESRIYLRSRGPRIFYWDLTALRRELKARGLDW